jgi:LPS export ABC transporter permease LptG/LPS export ABC transporter permease LptF
VASGEPADMLRTLDRYVIREAIVPFVLALLVFTFILQIPPIMEVAEKLIAKGVDWRTIGRIMGTLLPQALGITIPMATLVGLLVALGKLSSDRETVALQACGVSVFRLVRPVAVVALLAWAATSWVMIWALPSANQTYREIVYGIVTARAENEVRPRVFFEDFPNLVLYVRDLPPDGRGWQDVFLADARKPSEPEVFLAERGHLVLDRDNRRVDLVLQRGARHRAPAGAPDKYEVQRFETMTLGLDPETVFPRGGLQPGENEMTMPELRAEAAARVAAGASPHRPIMALHRKFSIPVACLVFGLLGLGLGVTTRKDGKQSSFAVAIGVIFVYYVLLYTSEALAKGQWIPAWLAMWVPNLVLGAAGLVLLLWRARFAELGARIPLPLPRPRGRPEPPAGVAGTRGPGPAAAAPPPARPALVIRVPRLQLPGPRVLDWYLARFYGRVFALAFVGMLGIFYIATFIDLSDKLFKGQTTGAAILRFFWYSTPQYVYFVLPIAALLAALVTVGLLTKSSELVVMKACGVSLYRATLPIMVFAAALSLVLFTLAETVLAHANRQAQAIRHVIRGGSPRTFDVLNRQWVAGRDGSLYHYAFFDPRREELSGLSIYRFPARGWRLAARSFTSHAVFRDGRWQGDTGWERTFDRRGAVTSYRTAERTEPRLEPAEYFRTEQPDAERMSYRQLRHYIGELRTSGFNTVPYAVSLQRKLSFPFVTIIMTLIAVPFAVTTGRHGALYGIGAGIVLAILYWLVISVFAAIGTAGLVPPAVAAWAPNLLFGAGAAYLLLTVRT